MHKQVQKGKKRSDLQKNKSKSLRLILTMINGCLLTYALLKFKVYLEISFKLIFFLDCFLLEDVFICVHESYIQLSIIVRILCG